MKKQRGSSLIVALILLTVITLVAVYSLEGSNIQSKMVANSLFSSLTYQECRNEQESQIRFNNINGGANRNTLLSIAGIPPEDDGNGNLEPAKIEQEDTLTEASTINPPKSNISIAWSYIQDAPASRSGYDIDTESPTKAYLYENDCIASFRFSTNSQTQGAIVEGLKQAGNIN
ncbi:MAG: pilus assembly PilX N-terminal domain-containing protein [Bermanella sp.]